MSVMSQARCFLPVSRSDARILILGSMPGIPSLNASEYYANPRNAFWRVMAAIFDFDPAAPYDRRLAALKKNRIALWDVIESCYREGSLDSAIRSNSVRINAFAEFLAAHRQIEAVFFNGGKAEELWRRHVAPVLGDLSGELSLCRLPSTSPAHTIRYEEKLKQWLQIKQAL